MEKVENAIEDHRKSLSVTEGHRGTVMVAETQRPLKNVINEGNVEVCQSRDAVGQILLQKVTEGCRRLKNKGCCSRCHKRPKKVIKVYRQSGELQKVT